MAGMKITQPFDPKKAQGNVIRCSRTGNVNHATEKPVDLIATILDVTDMAKVIYDPFLGSGTTLIACQNLNRCCWAIEISPAYCAVALQRMADAFPGIEIERIEHGKARKHDTDSGTDARMPRLIESGNGKAEARHKIKARA